MLIIPIEGKISWRHPPVVTLLIIAANCLIFFAFQSGDDNRYRQAFDYYFESGLAAMELPRYADHVAAETDERPETGDLEKLNSRALGLFFEMRGDSEFMQALYGGHIISPGNPDYTEWKARRAEFDKRGNDIVSYRYALVPAKAQPWMFITMMFLHGGMGHLLGNMVFLWIVGCVLELGLGRMLYGFIYILSGLCASGLYFIVHHNSYVPSLGASGAISGLMGALTLLYGTTRIRVFFSTGFYFDYFRMPAVLLLPFWLGKELLAFYFMVSGGVAYMAHAGGLIGGALLGGGSKYLLTPAKKAYFEEAPEDPVPAMIEDAGKRLSKLDLAGARQVLQSVLAVQPGHPEALGHLFNLEKQQPHSGDFHETARQYLSLLAGRQGEHTKARNVYQEYVNLAGRPNLPPQLEARLAAVFLEDGQVDAGKKIIVNLARRQPDLEALPALLLRLVNALERQGLPEKARKYRAILCKRYPHSQEARLAEKKR